VFNLCLCCVFLFVCAVCVCEVCVCAVCICMRFCVFICVFAVLDASATMPARFWPLFTIFFCDLSLILNAFILLCVYFIIFFYLTIS